MLTPLGSHNSGSYLDLRKRVIQRMHSARVDELVFKAVQESYEKIMNSENIVLSRPERERLLQHVMRAVLTDMLTKLEGGKAG